ncbi:CHAT domain-containing protein [Leptolyngbya ohadii]|uniref:CHAT domain-containing protein n=1 Tax=Leptolyngbya ohadii TaxID=1962290 RepID=UPI000B59C267|nr:CHAT domain-containing protein [Leptolyngbya ohadii]
MTTYRDRLFRILFAAGWIGATAIAISPPGIAGTSVQSGIELLPEEAAIEQTYQSAIGQAIQQGQELAALNRIPPSDRTPAQQQRITELRQAQRELTRRYREFINQPEVQNAIAQLRTAEPQQTLPITELERFQETLRNLDQNAALLYPLVLDDRLELLLLTPGAPPLRYTVQVSRQELNRAILEFRQALQNPLSDPLPPAQQLYDWLIRPLEQDLAAANTQSLLYAPDGALRYIPLVALHDGNQWLTERFTVNNLTAASLTDLTPPVQNPPRILAAAFTEGSYQVEQGDRQVTISGFPFARVEVENIAAQFPETKVLLNQEFTPEAVASLSPDHNILHLATTGFIDPGSPEDSFILFGNGDRVTLRDMRNWNLSNVDLVVLSGCETVEGGTLGDGRELTAFGYEMQRAGAKSVITSLWLVSDQGTQLLMNGFYSALKNGSAPAAALRAAQVKLIQGDYVLSSPDRSQNRNLKGSGIGVRELPDSSRDRFSHPYYWAPFILIGNGL